MKALARLKIALADLAAAHPVIHSKKSPAPRQPTAPVIQPPGPLYRENNVRLLSTMDAKLNLLKCGISVRSVEALAGSVVQVLRRDPFFVMIEHEGQRYLIPYTTLST